MSQPFEIDTDALGRAEAPFRELAQRLVALSDQVQSQVRGLGEVWGDDESGQGFVAKYGPARDELLTAFRSTGEVVTSTADGVRTMAQGFQRTEESNHDASSQLLRRTQSVEGQPLAPTSVEASVPAAGTMHAARRTRVDSVPAEPTLRAAAIRAQPLEPMQRGQAVRAEPLQPMQRVQAVAAQPLEPMQPAEPTVAARRETLAAEPMLRAQAVRAEPLEPMQPAEPTVAARVVEAPAVEALRPVSRVEADVATPDDSQRS